MDITNLAKDAIRIANTAGLSKDVIDLLTAKITLLDEKLIETKAAFSEVMLENQKLRKQVDDMKPVDDGLDDPACEVLKLLFMNSEGLDMRSICSHLNIEHGVTSFHVGVLLEREFIGFTKRVLPGMRSSSNIFYIKQPGRSYVMKKG